MVSGSVEGGSDFEVWGIFQEIDFPGQDEAQGQDEDMTMTSNSRFKKRVRARMAETGEGYQEARQIIEILAYLKDAAWTEDSVEARATVDGTAKSMGQVLSLGPYCEANAGSKMTEKVKEAMPWDQWLRMVNRTHGEGT